MIKFLGNIVKDFWHRQWVDHSNVRPKQSYNKNKDEFILHSSAGVIRFRANSLKDRTSFRDKFINDFERISLKNKLGINTEEDFKKLYQRIKKEFKVNHSANLKIRLKNVF